MLLADASRDQLRVLPAEIQDHNSLSRARIPVRSGVAAATCRFALRLFRVIRVHLAARSGSNLLNPI